MARTKTRHETSSRSAATGGVDTASSKGLARPEGAETVPAGGADGAGISLEDFAADMGRFLGTVQTRAQSWLEQRQAIAEQLTQIRDTANEYLQRMTGGAADMPVAVRRGRRGRPRGSRKAKAAGERNGPRRRGSKISAEGRARIAEAQRKRWAKLRREQKSGGE